MLNDDIMFTLQKIIAQKLKICNTEHWFLPQKTAILDFCARFVKRVCSKQELEIYFFFFAKIFTALTITEELGSGKSFISKMTSGIL